MDPHPAPIGAAAPFPSAGTGDGDGVAIPYYWRTLDFEKLWRDYPPPPHFERTTGRMSDDALRALQNARFLERMEDAWLTPFYSTRWRAVGIETGDIRSLDDIEKLPSFTSDDLKEAIAAAPPFGRVARCHAPTPSARSSADSTAASTVCFMRAGSGSRRRIPSASSGRTRGPSR